MNPFQLRQSIRRAMEDFVGRHDEPAIYSEPLGDPGLVGPGSISWELHSDMGSIAAAGTAAIVMEILHPSVMAGVYNQSAYREQTLRRARATLGYVVATTFGSTAGATKVIDHVRRMHGRVNGTLPDGRPYRAMDPVLIGWVHTAIPWAIMEAFDRYNRPLSATEKSRYLAEQAVIGRLSGADDIPVTVDELHDYVESMRPHLAMNEETLEFIAFLGGDLEGPLRGNAVQRLNGRMNLHASMSLMPDWARRLSGLYHPTLAQKLYFTPTTAANVKLIRWAYGTPIFRQLADQRVAGGIVSHDVAAPVAATTGATRSASPEFAAGSSR